MNPGVLLLSTDLLVASGNAFSIPIETVMILVCFSFSSDCHCMCNSEPVLYSKFGHQLTLSLHAFTIP